MKNILKAISSAAILAGLIATPLVFAPAVSAQSPQQQLCDGAGGEFRNGNCVNRSAGTRTLPQFIRSIINILLFAIGAVAVVMIIVGGFKYTVSNGDQSAVTSAKNTILYAVVGLVIAILAFAVVEFVAGSLT